MMSQAPVAWLVVAVVGSGLVTLSSQERTGMRPTVAPTSVTTRAALAKIESWTDTTVQLVSPGRTGETARVETVAAKRVVYKPGGPFPLTVVSVRDSGYTFLARSGEQPFFVVERDDLLTCTLDHSALVLSRDAGRILTPEGGLQAAVSQFVGTLNDAQLSQVSPYERWIRVGLIGPEKMWYLLEMFSITHGSPTIATVDVVDGVLRLDLVSSTGRMRESFWIDLKAGKLLKSAPFGKGRE